MPISLEKKTESATISLLKKGEEAAEAGTPVGDVAFQIVLAADYSQSTEWHGRKYWTNGDMQELAELILALSMTGLDDDQNVQVFPFHNSSFEPFIVDQSNYKGALDAWRYPNPTRFGKGHPREMGGTSYAAVIRAIFGYLNTNNMLADDMPPVVVFLETDGQSNTQDEDKRLLQELAQYPIFWMIVVVGPETAAADDLNNMSGRVIDNVGMTHVHRFVGLDVEKFYDDLLEEPIKKWLPEARRLGISKYVPPAE